MRLLTTTIAALLLAPCALAQTATARPLASVAAADADVSNPRGSLQVVSGRVDLSSGSVVTARDHTAPVRLARGGAVAVCRTGSLHVNGGGEALLLALDRGAMELNFAARPGDVLLTPDLRMTPVAAGTLDLRLRVSSNGDTCVENRGRHAPALQLSQTFGDATYELKPGQHVLFDRGSLRAVVDRETVPCGCPPDNAKATPLTEAQLTGPGATVTPAQNAAANPFPAAQSEGLAPTPVQANIGQPGQANVQVATTLSYNPDTPPAPAQATAAQAATAQPAPAKKTSSNPFAAIARFFKHLFVR